MSGAVSPAAVMDAVSPTDWLETNRRYLCAEFARIAALLRLRSGEPSDDRLETARRAVNEARGAVPGKPALDVVEAAFALSPFERDLLLLAAGAEMDDGIAGLCAAACGRPGRASAATFGLALASLPDAHWSALGQSRPLRRWRLLDVADGTPRSTSPLYVDERILDYLAGINAMDARLQPFVRPGAKPPPLMAATHRALTDHVVMTLRERAGAAPLVQLHGDDPDGQADVAAVAAAQLGFTLFVLRAEDIPAAAQDRFAFATRWVREAALLGAALLIEAHSPQTRSSVEDFVALLPPPLFVAAPFAFLFRYEPLTLVVQRPGGVERTRLWHAALGPAAAHLGPRLDVFASQFRLSARAIVAAGSSARRAVAHGGDPAAAIRQAPDQHARLAMENLAQRIESRARWDDLVLPETVQAALREVARQVQHRTRVHDEWGFGARGSRGRGITALFAGESGTGKTMAAEALANEVGLDLYGVDLSMVISKYIGETEQNLRRVFDAAEASGAILLFDEADALFGKRSEVNDSHDRYANIGISYLLQRMEAYGGLAILTTNTKSALDHAFYRRLRFVVQFPFPDAALRARIWSGVIPAGAPSHGLDIAKLARLNVAGGAIANIALNAAFRAAALSEPIGMSHVIEAVRAELAKSGKELGDADTRGWV